MIEDDLALFGLVVYHENMRESLESRAKRMRGILEKTKKRGLSAKSLLKQFDVVQKTISRDIRRLRDKKLLYISSWKDNKIPIYRAGSRLDMLRETDSLSRSEALKSRIASRREYMTLNQLKNAETEERRYFSALAAQKAFYDAVISVLSNN